VGLWGLYVDEPVLIVCELRLLSVRFGFSWWSQREWSWGGASRSGLHNNSAF